MIYRPFLFVVVALFAAANAGVALELSLPANAVQTVERNTDPDRYAAPLSVFENGEVAQFEIEGNVRRAAWRLDAPGLTPLQVMRPLRAQLEQAGFDIALDCASATCGGFDFRFATETLPGPNMYVNIRAFHFVTAVRPTADDPQEAITVLTSTSATSAYIQIIQAGSLTNVPGAATAPAELAAISPDGMQSALADQLLRLGHVALKDLDFATGTSKLGAGPFASLAALATFLDAQPTLKIALVGHTDSVGGLDGNITLSRRRAQSVRARLIDEYDVDAGRMDAQGMGYLAPVASNLTPAGREANRRVEVIVLSDE